jgi:acyl-CoA reductase-like NAD-dependent aldehyde dehydrogenase
VTRRDLHLITDNNQQGETNDHRHDTHRGPMTAAAPQLLTYRCSPGNEADRVPIEDPATGEVIAVVQGGGSDEVDAAVEMESPFRTPGRTTSAY